METEVFGHSRLLALVGWFSVSDRADVPDRPDRQHFPDFLGSLFKLRDCVSIRKAGKQESSVVSSWSESDLTFGANRFPHQPEPGDERADWQGLDD